MNNKILVLTDFSEGSNNALNYALNLAKEMGMTITLMHIPQENQSFQTASKKMEETFRLARLKEPDIKIVSSIESIPQKSSINDIIDREYVGIIVIGTEGVSGLKPVVMGSFANKIISGAKCSVIAVPVDVKYKGIRNILVLTQLDQEEMDSIEKVFRIAKDFDARITFFNVDSDKETQRSKSENFKKHIHESTGFSSFDVVLDNSFDIIDSVEKYVKESKPDLVVTLGKEQVSFENLFGKRLTKMLCLQTLIPILSLPNIIVSDPVQGQSKFPGGRSHL